MCPGIFSYCYDTILCSKAAYGRKGLLWLMVQDTAHRGGVAMAVRSERCWPITVKLSLPAVAQFSAYIGQNLSQGMVPPTVGASSSVNIIKIIFSRPSSPVSLESAQWTVNKSRHNVGNAASGDGGMSHVTASVR